MTRLTQRHDIPVDPLILAAFRDDPGRWLPEPAHRAGPRRWLVTLHGPGTLRTVACHVGPVWQVDDGLWRALSWEPVAERGDLLPVDRGLPRFRGELGLTPVGVVVDGRVYPPGGQVGQMVDSLLLHRVAERTARRFLSDVAARLSDGDVAAASL